MEETRQELDQQQITESTSDTTEKTDKPTQSKPNFFQAVARRILGRSKTKEAPETPKELSLEEQIAQNEVKATQLSAEQKDIVDRSLGDMTIADRRMATAKQAELEEIQRITAELRAKAEGAKTSQSSTAAEPEAVNAPVGLPAENKEEQRVA